MRKKITLSIIIFMFVIFFKSNIYAMVVGTEGYDDGELPKSHYALTCEAISVKNEKTKMKNIYKKGQYDDYAGYGDNRTWISLEDTSSLYVSDKLKFSFYLKRGMTTGEFKYQEPECSVDGKSKNLIDGRVKYTPNYDGDNHVKVEFTMNLISTGKHEVELGIEDDAGLESIYITIPSVKPLGLRVRPIYLQKGDYNAIGSFTGEKVFIDSSSKGIITREQCPKNFEYNTIKDTVSGYDYKGLKRNGTEIPFKATKKTNITAYVAGKGWTTYPLDKDTEYIARYTFLQLTDINEMMYRLEVDKKGKTTNRDAGDKADEEADAEAGKYIRQHKLAVTTAEDEPRSTVEFTDVLDNTDYYTKVGDIDSSDADKVEEKVSKVLGAITNVGIVTSVLVLAVLGIKYILGSIEEKAEYKKDMLPYLIGMVLLLSISTIVKILQNLGNSINSI